MSGSFDSGGLEEVFNRAVGRTIIGFDIEADSASLFLNDGQMLFISDTQIGIHRPDEAWIN